MVLYNKVTKSGFFHINKKNSTIFVVYFQGPFRNGSMVLPFVWLRRADVSYPHAYQNDSHRAKLYDEKKNQTVQNYNGK